MTKTDEIKGFVHIITPSKVPWAYTKVLVKGKLKVYRGFEINHYIGCTNNCSYCVDRAIAARFWNFKAWTKPILKFDPYVALQKLHLELEGLARRKIPQNRTKIVLSFMTDPFQPLEKKYRLTAAILERLAQYQFDVWVLTKSTPLHCMKPYEAFLPDAFIPAQEFNYYELMSHVPNLHYGISLNSLDYDEKREPNAPSPRRRLESLYIAKSRYHIDTYASLEPTYEKSILPVLKHQIMDQYCDFYILGKLNPSTPALDLAYKRNFPPVIQYLQEKGKKFLIKRELAELLGISEKNPEPKKPKSLEDYFNEGPVEIDPKRR